jgi:hypothetical protein
MVVSKEGALVIKCKVCEKAIRGNAAGEEYDEVSGEMRYTCKRCEKTFAQARGEE